MSKLKAAGARLIGGSTSAPSTPGPKLTMFQKLKIEVSMAKKYNGNVRRIPPEKLEEMYKQDPSTAMAKMNEDLGLNFESLEQSKKRQQKERRTQGVGPVIEDDDDPYKMNQIRQKISAVKTDAETGEVVSLQDALPEDVAHTGRRIDNLIWRQRLVKEVKEALDHPEYTNTKVLQRAVDIFKGDPKNAIPQPMSQASKYEKQGKVFAMLQSLRRTHAKQLYEMVLEEEARDKKRVQLMDWAKNDPARVAKLVKRFDRERKSWRQFIALVQHDNQMRLANIMTTYGLLR